LSDNGPCYISGELADYLEENGMSHTRGRPYHPQTQGKIERWHRSMKNKIFLNNFLFPVNLRSNYSALFVIIIMSVIMNP